MVEKDEKVRCMENIYKLSSGFKTFFWILAVLCFLMVIMIPATVMLIYIIYTAEVRITHDTFERRWLGKRTVMLNEITELAWLPTPGYLQKMMRPMRIVAKNPTQTIKFGLPIGAFEKSDEIVAELQKRTGKTASK